MRFEAPSRFLGIADETDAKAFDLACALRRRMITNQEKADEKKANWKMHNLSTMAAAVGKLLEFEDETAESIPEAP